jgi:hypothetical protein
MNQDIWTLFHDFPQQIRCCAIPDSPVAKAVAHVRPDKKRAVTCTVAKYKAQIHAAVCLFGQADFYTGEPLDWSLVSTYDNKSSKSGRTKYKKTLALLPTIDHTVEEQGRPKFVICSWYVNDAKSDLTIDEFYRLCERVLKHRDEQIQH